MILLDPDINGCIIWLINSPANDYKSNVTYIKGNIEEVCYSLVKHFTFYQMIKNQYGNYVKELCWVDEIYLDIAAIGKVYKDVFINRYKLPVMDVVPKSRNIIERKE